MPATVDEDIVMILQNHKVKIDARLKGWEFVLNLTGSEEGMKKLMSFEKFGSFLLAYLNDPLAEKETLNLAYKCLINISSTSLGTNYLVTKKESLPLDLFRAICDPSTDFVESKCYILSNISHNYDILRQEEMATAFPDLWEKHLKSCFCSSDKEIRQKYEFLALVFSNISRTPEGRELLIQDESFLSSFLQGLDSSEPATKRLGAALTIRNCCSDIGCHERLLKDLTTLLLPLMGDDDFDEEIMEKFPLECQYLGETKQREELPQVRKALVQTLSLLCYTEKGWNMLQDKGVYYVARELDLWDTDPDVKEAIETLVGYLLVENYSSSQSSQLVPEATDLLQDIADVVVK